MLFENQDIKIKRRLLINSSSFETNDNGIITIYGKNGTGKSLLLSKYFDEFTKKGISCVYINQMNDFILQKENVLYNITFSYYEEKIKKVINFLEKENLSYLLEHNPKKMSGGEKRLVSLIRGILTESKVLFIDEPTNDLDFQKVELLKKIFMMLKSNCLIVIVTHDDRIIDISDAVIKIEEKNLISNNIKIFNNNLIFDSSNDLNGNKKNKKIDFLKNQFNIKIISIISTLLLSFILIFCSIFFSNKTNDNSIELKENQLDIFVPISSYAYKIEEGAIPISFLKYLKNEYEIADLKKDYLKLIANDYSNSIDLELELNKSEEYEIYYIELYSKEYQTFLDTLEAYKLINNINYLDTSDYFVINNKDIKKNNTYKINIEDYNSLFNYDEIKEEGLSLVYCSLIFHNKEDMYDFLFSDKLKKYSYGNYFIICNDSINLINTAKILVEEGVLFYLLIGIGLISLFIESLFTYLYLKFYKKQIQLFRNMSYDKVIIMKGIYYKSLELIIKIIIVILTLIITIFIIITNNISKDILLLIIYLNLIYCFFNFIVIIVSKSIFHLTIKKYLDWRSR